MKAGDIIRIISSNKVGRILSIDNSFVLINVEDEGIIKITLEDFYNKIVIASYNERKKYLINNYCPEAKIIDYIEIPVTKIQIIFYTNNNKNKNNTVYMPFYNYEYVGKCYSELDTALIAALVYKYNYSTEKVKYIERILIDEEK